MARSFSIRPSSEDRETLQSIAPLILATPLQLMKPTHIYITGDTSSNNLATKHAFQWSRHSELTGLTLSSPSLILLPLAVTIPCSIRVITVAIGMKVAKGLPSMSTTTPTSLAAPHRRIWKRRVLSVSFAGTFQGGGFDGFVAKIDTKADGNPSLTYSTYFGGNINDRVESVAVDQFQRAYITGASNSSPSSFPLKNAFDSTQTNGEAFVAKLNADGTTLFYCSFLGGNNGNTSNDGEEGLGLAIDFARQCLRNWSHHFRRKLFHQSCHWPQIFRAQHFSLRSKQRSLPPLRRALLYSTTFGGPGARGEAIALDPKGNVYLGGITTGRFAHHREGV